MPPSIISAAIVNTSASRDIGKRLCRHLARQFPTTLQRDQGLIELPSGRCQLIADDHTLRIQIHHTNDQSFNQAKQLVADALQAIAGSTPLNLEWHRQTAAKP